MSRCMRASSTTGKVCAALWLRDCERAEEEEEEKEGEEEETAAEAEETEAAAAAANKMVYSIGSAASFKTSFTVL